MLAAHAILSLIALSSCFGTNIIWDLVDQGVFVRALGEFPSNFPLLGELSGTKLKDLTTKTRLLHVVGAIVRALLA